MAMLGELKKVYRDADFADTIPELDDVYIHVDSMVVLTIFLENGASITPHCRPVNALTKFREILFPAPCKRVSCERLVMNIMK